MREVDVIIPTKGLEHLEKAVDSLKYIPFPINTHIIKDGSNWSEAINIGLEKCIKGNDVLFMDDDVTLLPETFRDFAKWYDDADIFGFKLLFPDRTIQHAGGFVNRYGMGHVGYGKHEDFLSNPLEVAHVTASLMFVKREVLDKVGNISVLPGVQFEDVDFNMRALMAGFKILYLPFKAMHEQSKTKKQSADFDKRFKQNMTIVQDKYLKDREFLAFLDYYPRVHNGGVRG